MHRAETARSCRSASTVPAVSVAAPLRKSRQPPDAARLKGASGGEFRRGELIEGL